MPATPAWPPKSLPRLFVRSSLADGAAVELDGAQANYLGNVLRMSTGSQLLVFDGTSGEWLARITDLSRKRLSLSIERQTRTAEVIPDLWLAFAPVKRAQVDWLVQKATELGVARLLPVVTERTVVERVKLERLESIAIEAAEQCGRTALPEIAAPVSLSKLLGAPRHRRRLYFADENGGDAAAHAFQPGPGLILTGPEGGFTDGERAAVRAADDAVAISLGPRILRAETAALAAVAAWMAVTGDWNA
jgi:16S rRNA (uracil1498-N3)-methyltransferase